MEFIKTDCSAILDNQIRQNALNAEVYSYTNNTNMFFTFVNNTGRVHQRVDGLDSTRRDNDVQIEVPPEPELLKGLPENRR